MNAELKAKWINALRSGDYEQGRGALCSNNKFCCLGVLADIDGQLGDPNESGYRRAEGSAAWYGRNHLDENQMATLALMNDNIKGYTFDDIAYWIEENL